MAEVAEQNDWRECMQRVAQARCRDSFMQLYDYYAPRLMHYLRHQGASADAAEDIAQEAMLSVWRKAHLYDANKASVSTWLFRIARNQMIDRLRKDRSVAYDTDEELSVALVADDEGPGAADAAMLRRNVAALPQNQFELVYKSYFEGKSHADIAAETGQPLGSVKSRLRAAVGSLRQKFGADQL